MQEQKVSLTGDQAKQCLQEIEFQISHYHLTLYLVKEVLKIDIEDKHTLRTSCGELSTEDLHKNKLDPYFDHPRDLHHHLEKHQDTIVVNEDGNLTFSIDVLGKTKHILIPMKKNQFNMQEAILKKLVRIENKVDELREEKIKPKIIPNSEVIVLSKEGQMPSFVLDHQNIEFYNFRKQKNTITKIKQSSIWQPFFGMEIKPKTKFIYKVLQVTGSYIMYGIGTNRIRNTNNPHGGGYFAGFYSAGSNYQPSGQGSAGGTVSNGQTIQIEADLVNWTFTCSRSGQSFGIVPIPETMKSQPIFPVILMYSINDTIELVI